MLVEVSLSLWSDAHSQLYIAASDAGGLTDEDVEEPETTLWTWDELPGLFIVQYESEPDTVYWVAREGPGQLWLLANLPPNILIKEVPDAQHPSTAGF